MHYRYLRTRNVNATLWVEIHHPPVNFLTVEILEELHHLIREVEKDPSIRVFVLTGELADHYIMHFSIPELQALSTDNAKTGIPLVCRTKVGRTLLAAMNTATMWLMDWLPGYERLYLKLTRMIRSVASTPFLWAQMMRTYLAIERMNKVTIAAINGSCNGGGTEMSACFDFRFMISDRAFTIGQAECLVGIIPGGGGSQRIPRLIGKAHALDWMLRGHSLTPLQAKSIGFLTDCFDADEFTANVQAFADQMSRRLPVAVSGIKRAVHEGMETSLRHGLSIEMIESIRCFDDRQTQASLAIYAGLLRETVGSPHGPTITNADIMRIVDSENFANMVQR